MTFTKPEPRDLAAKPDSNFLRQFEKVPPTISSDELFEGRTEVLINHAGSQYRLKITRQGKLILNK